MLNVGKMKHDLMALSALPRGPGWDSKMRHGIIAILVGETPPDELQTMRFYEWACKFVDSIPVHRTLPPRMDPFVGGK